MNTQEATLFVRGKSMRREVRYRKLEDITKRVDRYKVKQHNAQMELAAIEQKLSDAQISGADAWRLRAIKADRDRMVSRLERISQRLARLKDRLGVFLTPEFSLMTTDCSIPA